MSKRFKLYNVNIKYIRNLHNVDDNVPSVSPQIGKQARPFLGIVVLVNGSKFCIPFTSNSGKKNKNFESMRENITFRKICDKNGKILAALNLNNMIPVRDEYVTEIDLKIHPKDSPELIHRYTDFTELTTPMIHEFVDKIVVHEATNQPETEFNRLTFISSM